MTTLSIDLASRRYADIGIALLAGSTTAFSVDLLVPGSLGLSGTPDPRVLASSLDRLAIEFGASSIFLDGPQGWRRSLTDRVHSRACEVATSTPGKTGPPGVVLPPSWTRMAKFSIGVCDSLHELGWPRFSRRETRAAYESFPTHAWRALGFTPLPGKTRGGVAIRDWKSRLDQHVQIDWPRQPSHDELQAVVAGIAGLRIHAEGGLQNIVLGEEPFLEDGLWREGFIVSPSSSAGRPRG